MKNTNTDFAVSATLSFEAGFTTPTYNFNYILDTKATAHEQEVLAYIRDNKEALRSFREQNSAKVRAREEAEESFDNLVVIDEVLRAYGYIDCAKFSIEQLKFMQANLTTRSVGTFLGYKYVYIYEGECIGSDYIPDSWKELSFNDIFVPKK